MSGWNVDVKIFEDGLGPSGIIARRIRVVIYGNFSPNLVIFNAFGDSILDIAS